MPRRHDRKGAAKRVLGNSSDWRKFGGNIAGQQSTKAILGFDLSGAQLRQDDEE
jgi:hypothetical protein